MIERKFSNDGDVISKHRIAISNDKEWGIANPRFFSDVEDAIKVYEYFEEKGYAFSFSAGSVLYFRRKK